MQEDLFMLTDKTFKIIFINSLYLGHLLAIMPCRKNSVQIYYINSQGDDLEGSNTNLVISLLSNAIYMGEERLHWTTPSIWSKRKEVQELMLEYQLLDPF